MVKVKICGITNAEDGFAAIRQGADSLGFVVGVSGAERSLDRNEAKDIFEQLRGTIPLVVLTDLVEGEEIAMLCEFLKADAVQLLKKVPLGDILELHRMLPGLKIFKTVHVNDKESIKEAENLPEAVDFVILDSASGKKLGGTGKKADWKICKKIVAECKKPVFLAGGLNPENVSKAIKQVKPFGVGVSSGIKMQNNKRKIDLIKLRKFIERAKKQ